MTHFSVLCKKYECIKNIKWFMKRGGAMRVYCTVCGQRGRITNSNQLSHDVSDLYCQCADAECGHSWVATLSFAHTLSPLANTANQLVLSLMGC